MKSVITLLLFFSFTSFLSAQSVTADYDPVGNDLAPNQYPLQSGLLSMSGNAYQFGTDKSVTISNPRSFALSDNGFKVGALKTGAALTADIYNFTGHLLYSRELDFANPADETVAITVLDSGEFVVRDNVSNFSFFDPAGNRAYTYLNSSQSRGGELPSEIELSSDGVMKVAYNPVIRFNNSRGSRISIVTGDGQADQIFSSQDETIYRLQVSDDDHSISVVTEGENSERHIRWFDRFGNLIFEMASDLEVEGFNFTDDHKYVTLFAGSRIQVYDRSTMERLGSASSRSTVSHAEYFPESNLIVAIGGEIIEGAIRNPEVTAVDLQKRQIDRAELSGTVKMMDKDHLSIRKTGSNSYRVEGLNKPLNVSARF